MSRRRGTLSAGGDKKPIRLWAAVLLGGLGLRTLSRLAGLGRNTVSMIGHGRNGGTPETWQRIIEGFRRAGVDVAGLSVEELRRPLTPAETAWCEARGRRMQSTRATVRVPALQHISVADYWRSTRGDSADSAESSATRLAQRGGAGWPGRGPGRRCNMISHDVLRHFGLARDPFLPPANRADLYVSARLRALEELVQETARRRGMLAIAGDVGSGKTIAVRRALQPLADDPARYRICYVQTLNREAVNARALLEAVLRDTAGGETTVPASPEALTRKVARTCGALIERNVSPLLVIDEAQALQTRALRPIKRLVEITGSGYLPGLGVILVGQSPELLERLEQPNVRELRARLHVEPMGGLGEELGPYINWRFKRAGARREVVARGAVRAIARHYRRAVPGGKFLEADLCGPLTVEADLTRALRLAHDRGERQVTAQVIHEVLGGYAEDEENGDRDQKGG